MPGEQIHFEPSTSYEDALLRAADENGIDREYWDILHKRHEVSSDVRRRLLAALAWNVSNRETIDAEREQRFRKRVDTPLPNTIVIGQSDKSVPVTLPAATNASICFELLLEDGQRLAGGVETSQLPVVRELSIQTRTWSTYALALPPETPLGYHRLTINVNGHSVGESNIIVCPERAYIPEFLARGGRTAGFNISLYGLRSDRNWGCGDFTDLRALIDWAPSEVGFSFIGLNPLHALHNRTPYNTSPYLPLSIFYNNLLYIDIESVVEFQQSPCAQQLLHSPHIQQTLRELRDRDLVAYENVDRLKRRFLKVLFREFRRHQQMDSDRAKEFASYCRREGDLLQNFALYRALDERLHKQDRNCWTWRDWPAEYQTPNSDACREFAKQHRRTVDFYKYVQFVIDEQLAAAQTYAKQRGMAIGLYHDLALAADSAGSDLWAYRDFFVNGCRVGAPPDDFSPNGQDWGFPPPNANTHQENGYRLFRESIRKIVSHGGALRIDHVMRLFRLFWIPDGVPAAEGIYVRDHAIDLLRILALESVRSHNIIIGEDLGTVTDEIRDTLARFGILSYRLFYFEKNYRENRFKHSYEYPSAALVASTTHDLPTLAGFWQSSDIEARKHAGFIDENGYRTQLEDRRREKQRILDLLRSENLLPPRAPQHVDDAPFLDGDLHNAIIGFLAQVPSMILLLNQEDLTKETKQQNLPGSTAEYPNWQRKMKIKIEELRSPAVQPYTAMFRDQLTRTGRRS